LHLLALLKNLSDINAWADAGLKRHKTL